VVLGCNGVDEVGLAFGATSFQCPEAWSCFHREPHASQILTRPNGPPYDRIIATSWSQLSGLWR
jgi:hypothetical protein